MRRLPALDERQTVRILRRVEEPFHAGNAFALTEKRIAQVSLWVGIDEQYTKPAFLRDRREEPSCMRLAHSTLQVENGDDRRRLLNLLHGVHRSMAFLPGATVEWRQLTLPHGILSLSS